MSTPALGLRVYPLSEIPFHGQGVFNKSDDALLEERASGEPMTNLPDESPSAVPSVFPEERRMALQEALRERFDMAPEDAGAIAMTLAEVFGAELEVNDEMLDPSTRSIFYTLEAKKILTFRRFEYSLETGERRRGFAWRIREEALLPSAAAITVESEEDVYANLPRDVWARQHA